MMFKNLEEGDEIRIWFDDTHIDLYILCKDDKYMARKIYVGEDTSTHNTGVITKEMITVYNKHNEPVREYKWILDWTDRESFVTINGITVL